MAVHELIPARKDHDSLVHAAGSGRKAARPVGRSHKS
jgi:hypothetical protein